MSRTQLWGHSLTLKEFLLFRKVCPLTLIRNIKLTIEYDGTAYHGWQSQVNASAIQDIVNTAINKLTGEDCSLIGSSRTDKGVHALGQAACFKTCSSIPEDRFAFALNTLLPEDIVIRKSEEVDMDFHARFSAAGKKYRYLLYNSTFPSALLRNRAYHVFYPLDMYAMKDASVHFIGTHDFLAFSATGSSVKTTVRTVSAITVDRYAKTDNGGNVICIEIEGNGFLYNMVRIIAGTLVKVGYGKIKPGDITGIIESRDRRQAGITAPAHGLYLVEIFY